jgi:ubiquinone/menaquinone biosynthesis C-methylase UbiE
MSHEAELPGRRFTAEAMQMIFTRYHTISPYVEGKTVLDVGCGAGIGLGYLVRKGAKSVVGIDYSMENLRIAKHYYNNRKIKIIQSDAHKMPFKDNYFDVITAMQVIQYLSIDRFLSECRRIFKRDGVLILCLPNKDRADCFQRSSLSKERIGNIIDHKSFVLANEIEDGIIESAKLVPISHKHPDIHHKILYVIAYSCESGIAQYKK